MRSILVIFTPFLPSNITPRNCICSLVAGFDMLLLRRSSGLDQRTARDQAGSQTALLSLLCPVSVSDKHADLFSLRRGVSGLTPEVLE